MAQVTVMFQEEGSAAAGFVIPDYAVEALQLYVDENPETYSGKADLFRKFITAEMIVPACRRYGKYPPATLLALQAAAEAKAAAEAAVQQAMADAVVDIDVP